MGICNFNDKEKIIVHHEVLNCCNENNNVKLSLDIHTVKPLTVCQRHQLENLICTMCDVLEGCDDN